MLNAQLESLASKASAFESAQRRLARLEEQSALGLSRLSTLEGVATLAQKGQEAQDMCSKDAVGLVPAEQQWQDIEQHIEALEAAHQELQGSKEAVAAELIVQHSELTHRTGELMETKEKVESLERIMVDHASQILALSSQLAGELTRAKDAEPALKDRAGNLVLRAAFLRDELSEQELDLSHLRNVCAALFSERTALELASLSETADASSLALLADLVRRFPLSAGTAGEGSILCHCSQTGSEISKLKLSEGTWWEAVD